MLKTKRMSEAVRRNLCIKISRVIFLTDSTASLRWFNSKDCRFMPYVGNRVGEILGLTKAGVHFIYTLLASVRPLSRIKRMVAYQVRWISIVRARVRAIRTVAEGAVSLTKEGIGDRKGSVS